MLLSLTVKNFLSFKNAVTFNLEGGSGNELAGNYYPYKKGKILKSAIVYGHNSSGKTNLLRAMDFVRNFIVESYMNGPNMPIPSFTNSLLDTFYFSPETRNEPSEFEVCFVTNEIEYRYNFSLDKKKIISETLYSKKTQKEKILFIRKLQDIKVYDFETNNSTSRVLENTLALSIFAKENSSEARVIHNFFANIHVFFTNIQNFDTFEMFKQDAFELDESKKFKTFLDGFLKNADLGIEGTLFANSKIPIENLPLEVQSMILQNPGFKQGVSDIEQSDIKLKRSIYDEKNNRIGTEYATMKYESEGTNKLLNLAGSIFNVIKQGKILFIDEIESNLHPVLQEYVINYFHNVNSGKQFQIIYTTHNTGLMDIQRLFRRDQIWFAEKNKFLHSSLNNLADIEGVRKDTNIEKNYFKGQYGGISDLNLNNQI